MLGPTLTVHIQIPMGPDMNTHLKLAWYALQGGSTHSYRYHLPLHQQAVMQEATDMGATEQVQEKLA